MKKYIDKNVYEATQERLKFIFDEFENVLVSFSGGKDSGVLLNLCYEYAKANNLLNKLAMYHLDYEAQYELTTEYVTKTFARFSDIKRYWLCLPVGAQCACNMNSGTWTPWKKEDRAIWCRELPKFDYVVNEDNCPFKFVHGESDYQTQSRFCKWFGDTFGKTAVMIGIRTDESLHRYSAIAGERKVNKYKGKHYIVGAEKDNALSCYPIYDWTVEDVWTCNAKFGFEYNRLYDLFYQAGLTPDQMRVASPFNDCATASLKFYKVIEPNTWGKLVSRVNGANFTGLYGGTTAMGWKSITLPKGHTWKSYYEFLLTTLNKDTAEHYQDVMRRSVEYWSEGGTLPTKDLEAVLNASPYARYIKPSEKYSDRSIVAFSGIPDDMDVDCFATVLSYKRMCICILKNDYYCKYAGFGFTKEALVKRKKALDKYRNIQK